MKKYELTISINSKNNKVFNFRCKNHNDAFDNAMDIIGREKGIKALATIYNHFGDELDDCIGELTKTHMELNEKIILKVVA